MVDLGGQGADSDDDWLLEKYNSSEHTIKLMVGSEMFLTLMIISDD